MNQEFRVGDRVVYVGGTYARLLYCTGTVRSVLKSFGNFFEIKFDSKDANEYMSKEGILAFLGTNLRHEQDFMNEDDSVSVSASALEGFLNGTQT